MKLTQTLRTAFVNRVMQDVPSVDYDTLIHDKANTAAVASLPPLVRAAYDAHPDFIATRQRLIGDKWMYIVGQDALPAKVETEIKSLQGLERAQSKARKELLSKLMGIANSATTTKKLRELLPEFEKYVPMEEEKTVGLPAVANVVADFVAAGWPKDMKAAA